MTSAKSPFLSKESQKNLQAKDAGSKGGLPKGTQPSSKRSKHTSSTDIKKTEGA